MNSAFPATRQYPERDEIVIAGEAGDEIPSARLQVAQAFIDDYAKDATNEGGPCVGRVDEVGAGVVMHAV